MREINNKIIPTLEGMQYGKSQAEKDFKTNATIGIVLLFVISLLHTAIKYLRNKN